MRINDCYRGVEDITLARIYEGFAETGYTDKEQAGRLKELEEQVELANVLGLSKAIAAVKELLRRGQRVAFISDMYLAKETIRRMLAAADPELAQIPLYVSGEYKKSKWTGSLYHLVRQKEQAEFSRWIHTGDNVRSDVEVPKSLGIEAQPSFFEGYREIEKYVLSEEKKSVYAEWAAGASRYLRMEKKRSGAWAVGVTAGANILLPYVLWILKEAKERGIRRLYFIARDGYILKQMADRILAGGGEPVETRYIYGSRRAWRLPGISASNRDLVELMSWSHPLKTDDVDRLAEVFGITGEELQPFLPQGFDRQIRFSSYSLYIVVSLLNRDPAFREYLFEKHKKARRLVKRYLTEQVDLCDDRFAFVELAGGGYTQRCLADILAEVWRDGHPGEDGGDFSIQTFYFKMDRVNHWKECRQFVFLPEHNVKNLILEMVCRACHGQTIGYEERDGRVAPAFDGEGAQLLDYRYDAYIEGILAYTEHVCEKNPGMLSCGEAEGLAVSAAYLSYLREAEDTEEFLYYADMPNNLTGRAGRAESFAPALTDDELERIFYSERFADRESIYRGTCFELSLERCSEKQKRQIEAYRKKAAAENSRRSPEATFEESFPAGILGSRILLYGAGRYGNQLYDILAKRKDRNVVQWVDRDPGAIKNPKMRVEGPEALGRVEYDCVLIGVVSAESAQAIRAELLRRGIPDCRIYWLGKADINRYLAWNQMFRWV